MRCEGAQAQAEAAGASGRSKLKSARRVTCPGLRESVVVSAVSAVSVVSAKAKGALSYAVSERNCQDPRAKPNNQLLPSPPSRRPPRQPHTSHPTWRTDSPH